MLKKLGNFKLFLLSNSLLAFAGGIFAPFWFIFLQNFGGGIEQFGFSIGLMALAQAVTSYYSGKHSDKLGRKIFFIIGGFAVALVTFAYTLINSLMQLYVLQILFGISGSVYTTMERVFLGDITKKTTRGKDIGKYNAVTGVIGAITMMFMGFVIGGSGFKIIFYLAAFLTFISTLVLFYIKE